MKYHNIPGIKKTVCTAEQKIAYNLAFRAYIRYGDAWKAQGENITAAEKSRAAHEIIKNEMREYGYTDTGKYNVDAIFAALNAGLEKYLDNPFIASSYEKIGAAFPAFYLEKTARA